MPNAKNNQNKMAMTAENKIPNQKLTHGSLFSGIGGFDYAAERMGMENVFHCEINPFGRAVLNHYWPHAKSFSDITETDFSVFRGRINILTGGFPCQDASKAKQFGGGQLGLRGARTGLFYHMCRAIRECQPDYVVAENVDNILRTNGGQDFSTILTELSGMGYNAEWRICRASDVGSVHQRARLYLVAYPNSIRLAQGQTFFRYVHETARKICWISHGTSVPLVRSGAWSSEPPAVCVDNGIPDRLFNYSQSQSRKERIKAYGNAIVPEIAYRIFKAIQEHDQ